eukprot:gb/GFBE01015215.1/.p1 GENE.gb/GFBE01015215.1/~~gb/GFBE01015215.1/.p1  ORF type:complete len:438 (+),score=109.40 gb/GFBE01015215.1/:1-1314(+)
MGIWVKSQELLRRVQVASHVRCLPGGRRNNKSAAPELAVRKLTDDVELLLSCPGNAECQSKKAGELCKDVQKQLHTILDLLKELSDEGAERKGSHLPPKEATPDQVEVLEHFIAADLPVQLLAQLGHLEFEARKDVMNVCCALLWPDLPDEVSGQVLEYLRYHPTVFHLLVDSYDSDEAALHCGVVLRSFLRHSELVGAFLGSGKVLELIRFAKHPSMDISSDAIYTLRMVMLEHKEVSGPWLNGHFDEFFAAYNQLLSSEDYVVERQALTLLACMLLDKNFQRVMVTYVSSLKNLQIFMNLLLDDSTVIQAEAFHVFKIFVVNPQKPARIQQILVKNKEKLVDLIQTLHAVRSDDTNFACDQQKVIGRLRPMMMPKRPPKPAAADLSRTNSSVSMATTTCETDDLEAGHHLGQLDHHGAPAHSSSPSLPVNSHHVL